MEKETSRTTTHPLSWFLLRLFDCSKGIDYLFAFVIGFWPIVLAALIGADQTVEGYLGYLDSPNWWSLAFLCPAILLAFRWVMNKIVPVGNAQLSESPPPIINILKDNTAKTWAYDRLRMAMLSTRNIRITLLLVVIVHVLDMWPVVAPYVTGTPSIVKKDWASMFFVEGHVNRSANFALLVFAYSAQFCVVFVGVLTIILILRHNVFFVRNIYQRRRAGKSPAKHHFRIDVDDVDRCFGFRVANEAFNTQVKALMIAGLAMFLSRYAHAGGGGSIDELFNWPPVPPRFSFPIAGQWLMALFWLLALFIVSMPAFVKLLPCLPGRGGHLSDLSVENYLREFFSDESWPKNRLGKDEPVAQVAAKFARNSFWPTGDNRASALFLFSYWIFFVILLPPVKFDLATLFMTFTVYGIAAYFAMSATFWCLKWILRYVDEMLVFARDEIPDVTEESDQQNNVSVFISYRRSDTAAYARSIVENLIEHFSKENVFIDIDSIEPGEKFGHSIEKALTRVDAVIVLIGKEWAAPVSENNPPRIHDPKDMVRFEIATALRLGKRLFPVLVEGARMPSESDLPEPLKELAQFNAVELSDHRWAYDIGLLLKALKSTP